MGSGLLFIQLFWSVILPIFIRLGGYPPLSLVASTLKGSSSGTFLGVALVKLLLSDLSGLFTILWDLWQDQLLGLIDDADLALAGLSHS